MGRRKLPDGEKKVKDAFAISQVNFEYIAKKKDDPEYKNKSRVVDAALDLFRSLEPLSIKEP